MTSTRWQYETVQLKPSFWRPGVDAGELRQILNDMGQKGWELAGMPPMLGALSAVTLIFKRPA
jgi:hypothetical protein